MHGVFHIAKSTRYDIDIYSDYLEKHYPHQWKVESWIRSHRYPPSKNIHDIQKLQYHEREWSEKQDHSKWAICLENGIYWVGDLNRMTTQKRRGGGGFLLKNRKITEKLNELISLEL